MVYPPRRISGGSSSSEQTNSIFVNSLHSGTVSLSNVDVAYGTVIKIVGAGKIWTVTPINSIPIRMGNVETSASGSIISNTLYDCVTLMYVDTNPTTHVPKWIIIALIGSITFT